MQSVEPDIGRGDRGLVHMTTVHHRYDTRILLKQCVSAAREFSNVRLLVMDGLPSERFQGVAIECVGSRKRRLPRLIVGGFQMAVRALREDADIYHLHDPELLPVAVLLRMRSKRVVFDSHEDVPRQILHKPYLWKPLRRIVSGAFAVFERAVCSRLDAVVAATPTIRDKFSAYCKTVIDVNNYPLMSEFPAALQEQAGRRPLHVCYVGGITADRGAVSMVRAMSHLRSPVILLLGGNCDSRPLQAAMQETPGWERVRQLGWLDRKQVGDVLRQSFAGLVVLRPTANYVDSLPVKMFEYMGAGIAVIASDFPLWRSIVDEHQCGICVDPENPDEIAAAIDMLAADQAKAKRMGECGRKAVEQRFNWDAEWSKLRALYVALGC